MTWLKKSSAVREWVKKLEKKEEEILLSIKTKKHEISDLNRLLEKVHKEMAEVSYHRQSGAHSKFRAQAKCCTACAKVLIKVQKNCAWKQCQGCSMWVCGVCIRQRKHPSFKPTINDELPEQEEPESTRGQPGDFQYHPLLKHAEEEEESFIID